MIKAYDVLTRHKKRRIKSNRISPYSTSKFMSGISIFACLITRQAGYVHRAGLPAFRVSNSYSRCSPNRRTAGVSAVETLPESKMPLRCSSRSSYMRNIWFRNKSQEDYRALSIFLMIQAGTGVFGLISPPYLTILTNILQKGR